MKIYLIKTESGVEMNESEADDSSEENGNSRIQEYFGDIADDNILK